jgi:hypothetical protein
MIGNQIKWGGLLVRLLKKHVKRLSLDVQWRPLYETLIRTHFKRYSSEHTKFPLLKEVQGISA